MDTDLDSECNDGYKRCTNIATVPVSHRNLALFLHPEEIRIGHNMRVHGSVSHLRRDELSQRKDQHCHLLSQAQAQQSAQVAALCVPRPRHPPSDHPQQQPGQARGILLEFRR